jgi:DNA mismatch repair ATPase MutL
MQTPIADTRAESLKKRQISAELFSENTQKSTPTDKFTRMTAEEYRNLCTNNKQSTPASSNSALSTLHSELTSRPASQPPVLPKEAPDAVKNEGRVPVVEQPKQMAPIPETTPAPIPAPQKVEDKVEAKEEKTAPVAQKAEAIAPQEAPAVPFYRIVGEVFNSYVIVQVEEKMLIIDKHAAH